MERFQMCADGADWWLGSQHTALHVLMCVHALVCVHALMCVCVYALTPFAVWAWRCGQCVVAGGGGTSGDGGGGGGSVSGRVSPGPLMTLFAFEFCGDRVIRFAVIQRTRRLSIEVGAVSTVRSQLGICSRSETRQQGEQVEKKAAGAIKRCSRAGVDKWGHGKRPEASAWAVAAGRMGART